ncbi:YceD family protein [Billgrantia gudaonensis]|uniref:Large ribosomal RNA subunit accumulation protein YceD n=1 Tax=Billgrantia gudaonensis TaxID=376427 RepID=A0A1G8NAV1_9GAMM|nr:YceD family protein [Halomonas gudaonensis]SDI77263.1 uncharacterized protein SAMN04487954_101275 [Halomonas gudaonensis]
MLTSRLPDWVEPYKLAARAERLEGLVALDGFARLAEQVGAQRGDCSVWLDFAIDAQGRREIHGRLKAELQLPCRRCLLPMTQQVESDFRLGMVTSDALAAELPSTHEPVLVENEQLNLLETVEDELILSLPQSVYHDEAQCSVSSDQLSSGEAAESSAPAAVSPFEVLRRLKGKP